MAWRELAHPGTVNPAGSVRGRQRSKEEEEDEAEQQVKDQTKRGSRKSVEFWLWHNCAAVGSQVGCATRLGQIKDEPHASRRLV